MSWGVVGGAVARMGAGMLAHIDQFGRPLDHPEGGFTYGLGGTDKGDDRPVGLINVLVALDRTRESQVGSL